MRFAISDYNEGKIINSEFAIYTLHVVHKILFYSQQYFYSYIIEFIYLNYSTMDVIQVLIYAHRKDKT